MEINFLILDRGLVSDSISILPSISVKTFDAIISDNSPGSLIFNTAIADSFEILVFNCAKSSN